MNRFVWLCGPSGVGKSSVGYEVFRQLIGDGHRAAYVDFDQIGLCRPAPPDDPQNIRISAANLAAVWPNFRAAGTHYLIASGIVHTQEHVARYVAAVPDAITLVCRLRVTAAGLRERIAWRGDGFGPPLPGEDMRGRSAADLDRIARDSIAEAERMERDGLGDVCLDTDGLSIGEVARAVRTAAGI